MTRTLFPYGPNHPARDPVPVPSRRRQERHIGREGPEIALERLRRAVRNYELATEQYRDTPSPETEAEWTQAARRLFALAREEDPVTRYQCAQCNEWVIPVAGVNAVWSRGYWWCAKHATVAWVDGEPLVDLGSDGKMAPFSLMTEDT